MKTKTDKHKPVKGWVVVDPYGDIVQITNCRLKRDSIEICTHKMLNSWDNLKKKGYRAVKATITLDN